MTPEEQALSNAAREYVASIEEKIILDFADPRVYPSVEKPVSIFMAGSPGAGKTEFSTRLLADFERRLSSKIVRIDADEIRKIIPQYRPGTDTVKGNAHLFQNAVTIGVSVLMNDALKNRKHFVLDATMANLDRARSNLRKSFNKERGMYVFYIYKDPFLAWKYTQARETLEGRNIAKDRFVDALFLARENVNRLKAEFGPAMELWLVEGDFNDPRTLTIRQISDTLDGQLSIPYNKDELLSKLP